MSESLAGCSNLFSANADLIFFLNFLNFYYLRKYFFNLNFVYKAISHDLIFNYSEDVFTYSFIEYTSLYSLFKNNSLKFGGFFEFFFVFKYFFHIFSKQTECYHDSSLSFIIEVDLSNAESIMPRKMCGLMHYASWVFKDELAMVGTLGSIVALRKCVAKPPELRAFVKSRFC